MIRKLESNKKIKLEKKDLNVFYDNYKDMMNSLKYMKDEIKRDHEDKNLRELFNDIDNAIKAIQKVEKSLESTGIKNFEIW